MLVQFWFLQCLALTPSTGMAFGIFNVARSSRTYQFHYLGFSCITDSDILRYQFPELRWPSISCRLARINSSMMTSHQPTTMLSVGARKISSWELYLYQHMHCKVWDMACDYNDRDRHATTLQYAMWRYSDRQVELFRH